MRALLVGDVCLVRNHHLDRLLSLKQKVGSSLKGHSVCEFTDDLWVWLLLQNNYYLFDSKLHGLDHRNLRKEKGIEHPHKSVIHEFVVVLVRCIGFCAYLSLSWYKYGHHQTSTISIIWKNYLFYQDFPERWSKQNHWSVMNLWTLFWTFAFRLMSSSTG